jgi:colanic acid/amylovoran biosynthesis glycosyltransferase
MPNKKMGIYLYNPIYTILKQPLFFLLKPIAYLKLLYEGIKTSSLIDFLIGTDFAHQMKKRGIDRIYSSFGDHKLFIGYYCKKLLNLPLLVTIHAHELYNNPNLEMFQKSLNACDKIITISDWNKDMLVNKFKISEKKILVNRLFVDTEKFKPDKSIKILIVAAFEKRKGHDILFKAIEKLNRDDIKILVVGGGERIPDADRSYPEALAKELQIDDKVVFFGKISEEVLKTLYNLCDIFVLPSKTSDRGQKEGIPVALMEAMSYGKPVISTRHAGIPELVEEILVEENNVEELAKAIELLADNPDLRKRLGERNRKIIEGRYSKKNVMKLKGVFFGAYDEIIEKN